MARGIAESFRGATGLAALVSTPPGRAGLMGVKGSGTCGTIREHLTCCVSMHPDWVAPSNPAGMNEPLHGAQVVERTALKTKQIRVQFKKPFFVAKTDFGCRTSL
ncbi:hypothetical protein, partial [Ruegeria arenilitoris]|uniref:hypothetical protein n=1 Tax=Ruegeria arenilitoris TaxID=1173585 RepID=UPI001C2C3E65